MAEKEFIETVYKGIAASPGVAHGPAFIFQRKELDIPRYQVPPEKREEEIARFEASLLVTRRQISAIRAEIEEKLGEDEAQIFDAHQLVLEDRALIEETEREVLESGLNIEQCFHKVASHYIEAFANIDDDYIKERVSDIRDVSRRVLHNLMGRTDVGIGLLPEPKVIVSDDVSPSDTANFDVAKVLAVVTDQGGRTSHAVIMARSINVPAVVGLNNLSFQVAPGTPLIVDGYDGLVIAYPSDTTLFRYGKIQLERENNLQRFRRSRHLPAQTIDGHLRPVRLNVEGNENEDILRGSGASGVGLFRTEALFMRGEIFPNEDEQYQAYRRILETCAPEPVVIRTLDLGGDKNPESSLFGHQEANPFMGYRAIRFCLEEPAIFKTQMRAILRAAVHGNARIMYPMITSVREVEQANRLLQECKEELSLTSHAFRADVPVGIMMETPAAAMIAELLAAQSQFFSIGTNDLIQYLLAVDRVNSRIAHLYEPNHPAVTRSLHTIIKAAREREIPVSVCGEMAGDPLYTALLLGLGATEISVSAGAVAELKFLIRSIRLDEAQNLAQRVLQASDNDTAIQLLQEYHRNCQKQQAE